MIPSFEKKIVVVPDFLPESDFVTLRDAALKTIVAKRVNIPTHKRGAAIAYDALRQSTPEAASFYLSPEIHSWVSSVVGESIQPTPSHDLSSCSLLIYDRGGDHFRCHYDLNFYRGRHFTMLLPLVNTNAAGNDVSSAQLFVRKNGTDTFVPTPPNTLVLFEGALVKHGVTTLGAGECRILLSMTYCANPEASASQTMQRRFKDIAYFGLRALWT